MTADTMFLSWSTAKVSMGWITKGSDLIVLPPAVSVLAASNWITRKAWPRSLTPTLPGIF